MKALSALHPRSSQAVNCQVLDNKLLTLSDNLRDETETVQVYLVYDYIVSCIDLELLQTMSLWGC